MKPAGFDNGQGIITAAYLKDPTDKRWDDDADMKTWRAWMDKYMPGANQARRQLRLCLSVSFLMHADAQASAATTLTRENVMKQAANFQKLKVPMLLPGITVSTSPTDYYPIQAVQLAALQGRDLGPVRRRHVGRGQLKAAAGSRAATPWTEGRRRVAFFFARFWQKLPHNLQTGGIRWIRQGVVLWAAHRRWPCFPVRAAFAQKKYDEGATDTEIKIGNTNPYSGPASSYAAIAKTIDAYFKSINDAGGINGRKIKFISLDDGYSPPKTVEMVRQLVEQDKVFALFQSLGTPCNTAIHKYMNQKKVPQLYVATGASKWGDPKNFPWTMGFQPDYHTEGVIYAKHVPGQRQGRQDRRAVPERRLRPGLSRRLQGGPGHRRKAASSRS